MALVGDPRWCGAATRTIGPAQYSSCGCTGCDTGHTKGTGPAGSRRNATGEKEWGRRTENSWTPADSDGRCGRHTRVGRRILSALLPSWPAVGSHSNRRRRSAGSRRFRTVGQRCQTRSSRGCAPGRRSCASAAGLESGRSFQGDHREVRHETRRADAVGRPSPSRL